MKRVRKNQNITRTRMTFTKIPKTLSKQAIPLVGLVLLKLKSNYLKIFLNHEYYVINNYIKIIVVTSPPIKILHF